LHGTLELWRERHKKKGNLGMKMEIMDGIEKGKTKVKNMGR
jgi:hypothetical protein